VPRRPETISSSSRGLLLRANEESGLEVCCLGEVNRTVRRLFRPMTMFGAETVRAETLNHERYLFNPGAFRY